MKAYVALRNDSNLRQKEVPKPAPNKNEVLIAVKAIGINPVDNAMRFGYVFTANLRWPAILGCDAAGVVEAIGSKVTTMKVGDRVSGLINFPRSDGTRAGGAFAEYVTAPAAHLALLPESLSYEEGAAISGVGLTAWQALFNHAHLARGQRVLVHGASGGVGHLAIQLAKNVGAHAIGVASTKHLDFVRSLGADEVVNYETQQFETLAKNVDVVISGLGDSVAQRSLKVMNKNAVLVALLPVSPHILQEAAKHAVTVQFMSVHSDGATLTKILNAVSEQKLAVHIGARYAFSELPQALDKIAQRGIAGKIVVTVP